MSLDVYLEDKICVHCGNEIPEHETVFNANITHNLGSMAGKANIYKELWRPEEVGIKYAKDLIKPLKIGLDKLKANPDHYKQFEPSNGWGSYNGLTFWIEEYLNACIEYPNATIIISR